MKSLLPAALALAVALPLGTPRAVGNGGTFATSAVGATGHLVPQRKSRIALESERLHVQLFSENANVTVEYRLANRGGAEGVTYGFPIDSLAGGYRPDAGVTNYEITDGNRRLDVRRVLHESANGRTSTEFSYESAVRDWYFSDLQFARGERKTLGVSYSLTTMATKSGTSKSFRYVRSKNTFRYTFRPAQTWGRWTAARVANRTRRARAP